MLGVEPRKTYQVEEGVEEENITRLYCFPPKDGIVTLYGIQ